MLSEVVISHMRRFQQKGFVDCRNISESPSMFSKGKPGWKAAPPAPYVETPALSYPSGSKVNPATKERCGCQVRERIHSALFKAIFCNSATWRLKCAATSSWEAGSSWFPSSPTNFCFLPATNQGAALCQQIARQIRMYTLFTGMSQWALGGGLGEDPHK